MEEISHHRESFWGISGEIYAVTRSGGEQRRGRTHERERKGKGIRFWKLLITLPNSKKTSRREERAAFGWIDGGEVDEAARWGMSCAAESGKERLERSADDL